MATKRGAVKDVNRDNWDQEDEPELAGRFREATTEQLKNRVLKKAKRRCETDKDSTDKKEAASPFSAFGGFASNSTKPGLFGISSTAAEPSWKPAASPSLQNGGTNKLLPGFSFGSKSLPAPVKKTTSLMTFTSHGATPQPPPLTPVNVVPADFKRNVKVLNESAVNWMNQHIQKNPYCILTPIFKDYEKYLNELEQKYKVNRMFLPSAAPNAGQTRETIPVSLPKGDIETSLVKPVCSDISFVNSSINKPSAAKAGFEFGSGVASKVDSPFTSSNFTFGTGNRSAPTVGQSGKAFSFAVASASSAQPNKDDDKAASGDEDRENEENPPEPSKPLEEEDAIYTQRCKLYYKKEDAFQDRGRAMLYLKPLADNKTQLLVRVDNHLGNILLNIVLSESIPIKLLGKKDILLCCIPNPPIPTFTPAEGEPVQMLIRVKTPEEAEKLLSQMEMLKS